MAPNNVQEVIISARAQHPVLRVSRHLLCIQLEGHWVGAQAWALSGFECLSSLMCFLTLSPSPPLPVSLFFSVRFYQSIRHFVMAAGVEDASYSCLLSAFFRPWVVHTHTHTHIHSLSHTRLHTQMSIAKRKLLSVWLFESVSCL